MVRNISYYMMECKSDEQMLLRDIYSIGMQTWFSGRRFIEKVTTPVVVEIVDGYETGELIEYFSSRCLMRKDLIDCIRSAGVDNIDVYDSIIRDTDKNIDYDDYMAVNIIGLVSCTDPEETEYYSENPSRLVDADIESLKIDESKTSDLLMFRLAECVSGVVVHEKIKTAVDKAGFENMIFYDPKDWVG